MSYDSIYAINTVSDYGLIACINYCSPITRFLYSMITIGIFE